jgi:lipoprotein-releasing system permease protein
MKLPAILMLSVRNFRDAAGGRALSRQMVGAIVGVALGLVPLIVSLEVADGMIAGITDRFVELGTYHLQAVPYMELEDASVAKGAETVEDLLPAALTVPERRGLGLVAAAAGRSGVTIRGLPPELYTQDAGFRRYLSLDAGVFDVTGDGVLVGRTVAQEIGVSVGDTVRLLTPRDLPSGGFVFRVTSMTVTGIFSTGYQELDGLWVLISSAQGERILSPSRSSSIVGIKLPNRGGELYRTSQEVQDTLGAGWAVYTWYELERAQYKSFQTTKALLIFIMVLILVVASVNISSSLVTMVIEKRQEIAILKSTGAHPNGIALSFVVTGLLTGVVGTIIGLAVGMTVAVNINAVISGLESLTTGMSIVAARLFAPFASLPEAQIDLFDASFYLERIPVRIDAFELLVVAAFSIALATAAAYFPARSAARIRPLDVMRKH